MQIFDKIYPSRIEVAARIGNFVVTAKEFFPQYFLFVLKLSVIGMVLLFLQALVIGVTDRIGVSPKTSYLVSSLFYSLTFGILAVIGGRKIAKKTTYLFRVNGSEQVCKMLIIRKKGV